MRHRVDADTDLELIPPEPDEAEAIAVPIPPEKRSAPRFVWLIAAVAAVALLAAAGSVFHLQDELTSARHTAADLRNRLRSPTTAPIMNAAPPTTFTVHVEQLNSQGLVAIASDGHLRILEGTSHVMRDVLPQAAVSSPMWSPSGRWVSYVVNDKQVWVTNADETDAHQVGAVEVARPDTIAWSPKTDTLAIITSAGIELVPTSGGMFPPPLRNTAGASSVAWSSDGTRIAFTRPEAGKMQLVVRDESGGGERVLTQLAAADEDFRIAGWWPDSTGLLAWQVSTASVDSAFDGADLMSISLSGTQTHLTTMLPYRQWLSWSPDGRRVAIVEGGGREATTAKHVAVCDVVAGGCNGIAGSPGTIAVDPAWSPDGRQIAYVQADDDVSLRFIDWLRTRELWTMRPDGSDAKRLGALDGVDWVNWSPDGKRLLAVGGENALWLVDPMFVGPVASPLVYGAAPAGDFYGFVDWSRTLAWHPKG